MHCYMHSATDGKTLVCLVKERPINSVYTNYKVAECRVQVDYEMQSCTICNKVMSGDCNKLYVRA